jgi:hypothetical protein
MIESFESAEKLKENLKWIGIVQTVQEKFEAINELDEVDNEEKTITIKTINFLSKAPLSLTLKYNKDFKFATEAIRKIKDFLQPCVDSIKELAPWQMTMLACDFKAGSTNRCSYISVGSKIIFQKYFKNYPSNICPDTISDRGTLLILSLESHLYNDFDIPMYRYATREPNFKNSFLLAYRRIKDTAAKKGFHLEYEQDHLVILNGTPSTAAFLPKEDCCHKFLELTQIHAARESATFNFDRCRQIASQIRSSQLASSGPPSQPAPVQLTELLKIFEQHITTLPFKQQLQRRGLSVDAARNNLKGIIDKIVRMYGITGWYDKPEQFKEEYIKLQILCSHIIFKSLESKNLDNLNAFILDFCQYGNHCNAKIKEIVHQNYLCAFNLIGNGSFKKLSDCESIDDIVTFSFQQAFEKTVQNLANLILNLDTRKQSIHTSKCVRILIQRELDITPPLDPNQALDKDLEKNDEFAFTGIEEFENGCIKDLFPQFFSYNLIKELKQVQLELLKGENYNLLGLLSQAVYTQLESQVAKTPDIAKNLKDYAEQGEKLKQEMEENKATLVKICEHPTIIRYKKEDPESKVKELDGELQRTASEITRLMEQLKFLKNREEKTATSILPTIFSGTTHKRKATDETCEKTLVEEKEAEIGALETKRTQIREQMEDIQSEAEKRLNESPEIKYYLERLEKAKVLEMKHNQFVENKCEIQKKLQSEAAKLELFYESNGLELVSLKGLVSILKLTNVFNI